MKIKKKNVRADIEFVHSPTNTYKIMFRWLSHMKHSNEAAVNHYTHTHTTCTIRSNFNDHFSIHRHRNAFKTADAFVCSFFSFLYMMRISLCWHQAIHSPISKWFYANDSNTKKMFHQFVIEQSTHSAYARSLLCVLWGKLFVQEIVIKVNE